MNLAIIGVNNGLSHIVQQAFVGTIWIVIMNKMAIISLWNEANDFQFMYETMVLII